MAEKETVKVELTDEEVYRLCAYCCEHDKTPNEVVSLALGKGG